MIFPYYDSLSPDIVVPRWIKMSCQTQINLEDQGYAVEFVHEFGLENYDRRRKELEKDGWTKVEYSELCDLSIIGAKWSCLMKKKRELEYEI